MDGVTLSKIRDYGGFGLLVIIVVAWLYMLITNNINAPILTELLGPVLAVYLVADRAIRIAHGNATGKYTKDDTNGDV